MIGEICLENVWGSKRTVRSKDGYRHPSGVVRVSKDGLIVHIHCPAHVDPSAIKQMESVLYQVANRENFK